MKKIFILLILVSCCVLTTYASPSTQDINVIQAAGEYTGTLKTRMGKNNSSIDTFTLSYLDGTLIISPFKVGKMPGAISVLASGLVEGMKQKCTQCVTLTIGELNTKYDAYITVNHINQKLNIIIDVINPIYEGASYVAHVEFVEK